MVAENLTPESITRSIEWLTLAGIIFGPVLAVFVTRGVDYLRGVKQRREDLFKILMRTRGTKLSPEHVGALNLVEIEFYKDQRVLTALEKYFQHLNDVPSSASNWLQKTNHLFTILLSAMAKSLGYQIEQLQILTGAYAPQGWEHDENRRIKLQEKMIDVLEGNAPLKVTNTATLPTATSGNTFVPPEGFPPPPNR